jgi:dihydroflavonol-4-reductase
VIAVTGGTGHIGNVLVRELVSRGERVRVLVRPGRGLESLAGLPLEVVEGDVCEPSSVREAESGADLVYHLAGLISISPGGGQSMHATNVEGTRNVLAACAELGTPRLVYTSSVHAFAELPRGVCLTEDAPIDPRRVLGNYARSKAAATLAVREAAASGLDAVVTYPSGVMGPFDYKPSEMGQLVLDIFHRKLPLYVDGAYDFVDVRDVAAGLIAAASRGRAGDGYLLCGRLLQVRDLLDAMNRLTGVRTPRLRVPRSLARTAGYATPAYYRLTGRRPLFTTYSIDVLFSNCEMTSEKARNELGFEPRPFLQTLDDTLHWFRRHDRL